MEMCAFFLALVKSKPTHDSCHHLMNALCSRKIAGQSPCMGAYHLGRYSRRDSTLWEANAGCGAHSLSNRISRTVAGFCRNWGCSRAVGLPKQPSQRGLLLREMRHKGQLIITLPPTKRELTLSALPLLGACMCKCVHVAF